MCDRFACWPPGPPDALKDTSSSWRGLRTERVTLDVAAVEGEEIRIGVLSDLQTNDIGTYEYDAVGRLIGDSRSEPTGGRVNFAVMMVDLDRLKPINDQHGHEAGDRVLVQIAEILRHVSRTTDQVVRWGGDEFLLICQGADMTAATDLAERIRAAVTKQIFRVGEGVAARSSCSIGFAVYPFVPQHPEFGDWEGSLAMADAALYQAKRLRNSWVGWCGTSRALPLPSRAFPGSRNSAGPGHPPSR